MRVKGKEKSIKKSTENRLREREGGKERVKYQNNSQFDNLIFRRTKHTRIHSSGRIVYDETQTLSNIYVPK